MNPTQIEERHPNSQSSQLVGSTDGAPQSEAKPRAPGVDMYRAPHKMLRFMLANLLVEMGATSFDDPAQVKSVITNLEMALWACDEHIVHEDVHIRPALASRAPNAVSTLDAEHSLHAQQVAELRALATALGDATRSDARTALGETLYLHFSVFVAETLSHMAYEERVVQPLLDRFFSTQELLEIHGALIASIAPQDMAVYLRAMIPASNREERAEMLGNVKANAPPEAFEGIMSDLRPRLGSDDWADLCRRLSH
jgi:hemerythrin-like domain-containing protein